MVHGQTSQTSQTDPICERKEQRAQKFGLYFCVRYLLALYGYNGRPRKASTMIRDRRIAKDPLNIHIMKDFYEQTLRAISSPYGCHLHLA